MYIPFQAESLSRISFAALVAVAVFNFQGCSDYQDNPAVNLKSKVNRLDGRWKLAAGTAKGKNDVFFDFRKDGDFRYSLVDGTDTYVYDGDWEWANDDKNQLRVFIPTVDTLFFDIARLTPDELNMISTDGIYADSWEFDTAE